MFEEQQVITPLISVLICLCLLFYSSVIDVSLGIVYLKECLYP